MNSRFRIYAAAGLAGVLALGGGFMVLGRGQAASTAPAAAIKPLHPVAKKKRAKAHAAVAKKAAPKRKSSVPTAVRKARATQLTDGMPAAVSAALTKYSVVVVALVAPEASVDGLAYEEARAGARQAGAGFVKVSVANSNDVQALSTLVNSSSDPGDRLLDAPAVLVFRQPHELFVRFNGFIDAATVAQAATNAAPITQIQSGASALADPWVSAANAACRRLAAELKAAPLPTSTSEYLPYAKRQVAIGHNGVTKLRALKPPAGKAGQVKAMLDHYDAMLAFGNAILDAAERGNLAEIQRLSPKVYLERAAGDEIAAKLGAADCASKQ